MEVTGTFEDGETITDDKGGSAFADGAAVVTSKPECCFELGGCGDPLRPYPPVRQTPLNKARNDLDPSLAYDMSKYGHLGYDPALGPPDPNNPVQDQYTGTWEMFTPLSDDPRVGRMLAKYVLNAAVNPMVYLTNGEVEGIAEGESVTFEAHVTGGGVPSYTYEWSVKKAGDASWSTVGGNSSSWTWDSVIGDEGIYDVQCMVTDSQTATGEAVWEGFLIGDPVTSTTTTMPPPPPTTTTTAPGLCSLELIYGEDTEQTELLRDIRDNVLNQTPLGQEVIKLYYQWSPVITHAIKTDEEFRKEIKEMIERVLPLVEKTVE